MLGNPLLLSDDGYNISRSVRLRSSASAYFNRTAGTQTSNATWTFSAWVKRGLISYSSNQYIIQAQNGGNTISTELFFGTNDTLTFREYTTSGYTSYLTTTQVFRDPAAWYHIELTYDASNATSGDRVRLYINGTRVTSFSTATYPSSGQSTAWNTSGNVQKISYSSSTAFDGYLTEVNFIDGQALTPSSFGETDAVTGVWKPKRYAGTYGTNGFYLNFSDNSNNTAATIGKDYSGNGNNWTPNNISVTSGVTYDSMLDTPTPYADGGNGRGNYAVMNPLDQAGGLVFADGNLKVTAATGWDGSRATFSLPSTGKYYWEVTCISRSTGATVGLLSTTAVITGDLGAASTGYVYNSGDGNKYNNSSSSAYGATWGTNNVIGIAWDADTGTLSFYKDGASQGTAWTGLSGTFSPAIGVNGSDSMAANFGQRTFAYTPPTGFKALNTQNLPDATIKKGSAYFDATTYTGNGSAGRAITTNVGTVDFAWVKLRSGADDHRLANTVTGGNKHLQSNTTAAEGTGTNIIQSFSGSTFTVGSDASVNANGSTYIGWTWQAGGTAVTNTAGSITSSVSAGVSQGFSVVTYTTTTGTVGHGLGVAPSMIIMKARNNTDQWTVGHKSLNGGSSPWNYGIPLNTTAATQTNGGFWNNTAPTSSVFSVGSWSSGFNMVAYCFAEVAGYSKFGSYTGNGSADGPFVYCGFRPRFVMIKRTDVANDWVIYDTARATYNAALQLLYPNLSNAEVSSGTDIDITSNGFKIRNANNYCNASGGTLIYAAFAESPFRNSLAR